MSRETKTVSFQVKDLGIMTDASGQEFGQIEACGAVFNNVDADRDRINPGAFKRTLKSAKDRAVSRQKKYLAPMLWQHDTHEIIGGWYELSEDATGLVGKGDISLATQRGREYYALAKAGMTDQFSIIYDIPSGGAHYDKSGVRDLTELRLFSIDPVTFAANDATFLVNVKNDREKGARMNKDKAARGRQRKTFEEHYQEEQCKDLLEDWQDVVLSAFTHAVHDAFTIGDQPESDVNEALDGFKAAVSEWVADAVKYGLADYLDSIDYDSDPGLYRMLNGSSSPYGYMARQTPLHRKAMTEGDATTGGFTADHVDKLHGAATKATKAVDKHVATLQDAAESVKSMIGQASKAAKAGRAFSAANEQALSDHADALDDAADALKKSMSRHMGTVNSVADDLATVLQGSEPTYTSDSGTPADGHQEGKQNSSIRASSQTQTRAPHTPPSQKSSDTVSEDDVTTALAALRTLRTPA